MTYIIDQIFNLEMAVHIKKNIITSSNILFIVIIIFIFLFVEDNLTFFSSAAFLNIFSNLLINSSPSFLSFELKSNTIV